MIIINNSNYYYYLLTINRLRCTTKRDIVHFLRILKTAQVFEKSEVKVWECRNCGHVVVGTKAPEICPVCNHPQSYFEIREENY